MDSNYDEQEWVVVSPLAPDSVHEAVEDLFCDLLDSGVGVVAEYYPDGTMKLIWSSEYNDLREAG